MQVEFLWLKQAKNKSAHALLPSFMYLFIFLNKYLVHVLGLPQWLSGKEFACQCRSCRRCGFDPWIGEVPCISPSLCPP